MLIYFHSPSGKAGIVSTILFIGAHRIFRFFFVVLMFSYNLDNWIVIPAIFVS